MPDKSEPAFPTWELNGQGQPEMTCFDMTLRDYFAAKAMQGFVSSYPKGDIDNPFSSIALDAYDIADAMLKARGEGASNA